MKKTTKLFFWVTKRAPNSGFVKKNLPAYLCGYGLQNGVWNFFLNKWFSRYLSFGDFKVPKNYSSQ